MHTNKTILSLFESINLDTNHSETNLLCLEHVDYRYLKDIKVNVSNTLNSEYLSKKETALISLSLATNATNPKLIEGFSKLSEENGASKEEVAEAISCASLLSSNNVLYRFRHFMQKESYTKMPGNVKMNIIISPVLGKELFELMSLAISAVNGCELCVKSHEDSLLKLGTKEQRIWDTIRLTAVITGLSKLIEI